MLPLGPTTTFVVEIGTRASDVEGGACVFDRAEVDGSVSDRAEVDCAVVGRAEVDCSVAGGTIAAVVGWKVISLISIAQEGQWEFTAADDVGEDAAVVERVTTAVVVVGVGSVVRDDESCSCVEEDVEGRLVVIEDTTTVVVDF